MPQRQFRDIVSGHSSLNAAFSLAAWSNSAPSLATAPSWQRRNSDTCDDGGSGRDRKRSRWADKTAKDSAVVKVEAGIEAGTKAEMGPRQGAEERGMTVASMEAGAGASVGAEKVAAGARVEAEGSRGGMVECEGTRPRKLVRESRWADLPAGQQLGPEAQQQLPGKGQRKAVGQRVEGFQDPASQLDRRRLLQLRQRLRSAEAAGEGCARPV